MNKFTRVQFLLVIFLSLINSFTKAQENPKHLQRKRDSLKKVIITLNKELNKTKKESETSLLYLATLSSSINKQKELVGTTSKEISLIKNERATIEQEINELNKTFNKLKRDYANTLVKAYKNQGGRNKVFFILSSENIQQAYLRIKYLQKYSEYREQEMNKINLTQNKLKQAINLQDKQEHNKKRLLIQQKGQMKNLSDRIEEQRTLVNQIKSREGNIIETIKEKQYQDKIITNQILTIIKAEIKPKDDPKYQEDLKRKEEEIRRLTEIQEAKREEERLKIAEEERKKREAEERRLEANRLAEERIRLSREAELAREKSIRKMKEEEARRKAKEQEEAENRAIEAAMNAKKEEDELNKLQKELAKTVDNLDKVKNTPVLSTENVFSLKFEENKGTLPWPTNNGQIVGTFGKSKHPAMKNITVENSGINIIASEGSSAIAIFPGTVKSIMAVPGGNKAVLVDHQGGFYTLYANLGAVNVKVGDKVKEGSSLGTIFTDSMNNTILDFQLWKGMVPQDPQKWIINK